MAGYNSKHMRRILILTLCITIAYPAYTYGSPLSSLIDFLKSPTTDKSTVYSQPFIRDALSKEEAEQTKEFLSTFFANNPEKSWPDRYNEMQKRSISLKGLTMPFAVKTFGNKPKEGYSLYISMHGGGGTTADVNNEQWENQKNRYSPPEGKYVAPRAPTDTWNMWFQSDMVALFNRLIENMILFEEVNPNRVYLLGYSAGGDGVYQIAPVMADKFAAASMSAGHPNDSNPFNLRNIAFQIQIGGKDSSYNRNKAAETYSNALDSLAAKDPGGYVHDTIIYKELAHAIPDFDNVKWLHQFDRNPFPTKVRWLQKLLVVPYFYWLGVNPKNAKIGDIIEAEYIKETNSINIKSTSKSPISVYLNDSMLNLDKPINVSFNGKTLQKQIVKRQLLTLIETYYRNMNVSTIFSAKITVSP